jgi:hypothetical protein
MGYFRQRSIYNSNASDVPFQVIPWTGEGSGYMVSNGVCFSTFSYDTGSFIPIKGLNEKLEFKTNEKIYIEYTMLSNLQVSGAKIMCNQVGTADDWATYPNMFEIKPNDTLDDKGKIKTIVNGKRQTKCYSLIAYRTDDTTKNSISNKFSKTVNGSDPIQILDTDVILLATTVSGVPVVFPSPFYGGTTHFNAIQADISAKNLQSGSSV